MGKKKTKKKIVKSKKQENESNSQKLVEAADIGTRKDIIRAPAEQQFMLELKALQEADSGNIKPENWLLSPQMVLTYIFGSNKEYEVEFQGQTYKIPITQKFYGKKDIVERALVTLASDRGLLLVGEPGTGKSWLSEHICAAISGDSTLIIQGTAGTTEEQIKYGWNIALLIAEGQKKECLIPSPTMLAMQSGKILRFEEITRCTSDIQDSLVSILSEKAIVIPELPDDNLLPAKHGFNVVATANLRDKGVNELSAALKRRFNYITIPIINDLKTEVTLVSNRTQALLKNSNFNVNVPTDVVTVLCQAFRELRDGVSSEGIRFTSPKTVMSSAEEIAVLQDAAIYAHFFRGKKVKHSVKLEDIAKTIQGSVVKEDKGDLHALKEYWEIVLKRRAAKEPKWGKLYTSGQQMFEG